MPLTEQHISKLLTLVTGTEDDESDCDRCFDDLAAFAETELENRELPEALHAVETHLSQCPCCQDEYEALLEGLRKIED